MNFKDRVQRFCESDERLRRLQRASEHDPEARKAYTRELIRRGDFRTRQPTVHPVEKQPHSSQIQLGAFGPPEPMQHRRYRNLYLRGYAERDPLKKERFNALAKKALALGDAAEARSRWRGYSSLPPARSDARERYKKAQDELRQSRGELKTLAIRKRMGG